MTVIGFMGLAKSGKTTGANLVYEDCEQTGNYPIVLPFAGPLKEGLANMGITKGGPTDKIYRRAAQFIGTDIVRKYDSNWWVRLHEAAVNAHDDYYSPILVDDVRFKNETIAVTEYCDSHLAFVYTGDRMVISDEMYNHESEKFALSLHKFIHRADINWNKNRVVVMEAGYGPIYILNNTKGLEDYGKTIRDFLELIESERLPSYRITEVFIEDHDKGMAG